MEVLVNHLGYDADGRKTAVYQGKREDRPVHFCVRREGGETVFEGIPTECGEVAQWNTGYYWTLDFSDWKGEGVFCICLETSSGTVVSESFEIRQSLITMRLINAACYYFKAQRSSGEWLHEDRSLSFDGERAGRVDAHGGWYDATGDYGIHLSHLSHGTVHNPQQASFSAYTFFKAAEELTASGNEQYTMLKRRMLDEGCFGADFLMRLRAPSGGLFRSISRANALAHVRGNRKIGFEYHGSSSQFSEKAATADEEVVNDTNYEVSLRSGGGTAIAALAAASRHYYPGTDYTRDEYLLAAKDAWHYLYENNEQYTNDGAWNLIDEYCSLLALTELFRASEEYEYLMEAGAMAERIYKRMVMEEGQKAYLTVRDGEPYYHAADEGLPVMALIEYAAVEMDEEKSNDAIKMAEMLMRHMLFVSTSVSNPFGYPRFLYKDEKGIERIQFFFPHHTAVEPWWQGENARIASLSAAARALLAVTRDTELKDALELFADQQINWIMGLNPFNSCMMEGYGRNNIQYFFNDRYDFMNCPGGICNGITSAEDNEEGIALIREPGGSVKDNWRWAEQWIPHVTWFILAEAYKRI